MHFNCDDPTVPRGIPKGLPDRLPNSRQDSILKNEKINFTQNRVPFTRLRFQKLHKLLH